MDVSYSLNVKRLGAFTFLVLLTVKDAISNPSIAGLK